MPRLQRAIPSTFLDKHIKNVGVKVRNRDESAKWKEMSRDSGILPFGKAGTDKSSQLLAENKNKSEIRNAHEVKNGGVKASGHADATSIFPFGHFFAHGTLCFGIHIENEKNNYSKKYKKVFTFHCGKDKKVLTLFLLTLGDYSFLFIKPF